MVREGLLVGAAMLGVSAGAVAQVTNAFDRTTGSNTYRGGLSDGNWVGTFSGVTPNAGAEFFASANGNASGSFPGLGITKVLGGAIQNQTYAVSFVITRYPGTPPRTLSGVDFAAFSALRIGGAGGTMAWTQTPTPIVDAVWVKWEGTYTPSAGDIGTPFQFIATFRLDALHSIGIDGPVVAALPGSDGGTDGGFDGGAAQDAGATDSGAGADAGPGDSGSPGIDGGGAADAGVADSGGPGTDGGGAADAGSGDSGSPISDAGAAADAGGGDVGYPSDGGGGVADGGQGAVVGCGCSSPGHAPWALLACLGAFRIRRRASRGRGSVG